jgi:hypothetical protein
MRGPGGPAGLQNRFAAVMRPWRFDSPAFRIELVSPAAVPPCQPGLAQAKVELLRAPDRARAEMLTG